MPSLRTRHHFSLMTNHTHANHARDVARSCTSSLRIIETLNVAHFVARQMWLRRGVSPRRGKAHRLQRRAALRGLLVPIDTTFDLLHTARNCAHRIALAMALTPLLAMPPRGPFLSVVKARQECQAGRSPAPRPPLSHVGPRGRATPVVHGRRHGLTQRRSVPCTRAYASLGSFCNYLENKMLTQQYRTVLPQAGPTRDVA